MKKWFALVLSVALIFSLCAGSFAETKAKDVKDLKLGFVMDQATTQVISAMGNAMVAKAKELGCEGTLGVLRHERLHDDQPDRELRQLRL